MQIIDAHHHLWDLTHNYYPWLTDDIQDILCGDYTAIQSDYLITDYLEDIKNQTVVKSVHLQAAYDPNDPVGETRWLQAVADSTNSLGFPHGIVAFADFSDPNVEAILEGHCQYPNIRGIRHILNRHVDPVLNMADRDYLNDPTWRRNFGLLKKYNLSFDLQVYYQQMVDAASLAREYPDIQIILNHTDMPAERDESGLDGWREGLRMLAACPNIAAKISGLGMVDHHWTVEGIRPFVLQTIEIFGIDWCMFASNFPVDKLMSDYDATWNAFKEITADFSEDDRRKLFHDNAARYYRL